MQGCKHNNIVWRICTLFSRNRSYVSTGTSENMKGRYLPVSSGKPAAYWLIVESEAEVGNCHA